MTNEGRNGAMRHGWVYMDLGAIEHSSIATVLQGLLIFQNANSGTVDHADHSDAQTVAHEGQDEEVEAKEKADMEPHIAQMPES